MRVPGKSGCSRTNRNGVGNLPHPIRTWGLPQTAGRVYRAAAPGRHSSGRRRCTLRHRPRRIVSRRGGGRRVGGGCRRRLGDVGIIGRESYRGDHPIRFLKYFPGVVPVDRDGGITYRRAQHFGELIDVGFEALPQRIHRRAPPPQPPALPPTAPPPVTDEHTLCAPPTTPKTNATPPPSYTLPTH